ncbi:MAG: nitroreductase family protein [Chloroflexi bacterium]|nr:nitroreductase family protein [Chloroflexota bacterium]
MENNNAILTRRTIKEFKPDLVPADVLDRVLTAGTLAQNHRLTEPWRFCILGTQTYAALAAMDAKMSTKPAIVAVTCVLQGDAFQRKEDYAAVACAVQNIQLAAWAEGVGMQWSTGRTAMAPETMQLLGIDPQVQEMVGLLFFGYPAVVPAAARRKPLAEVVRRLP